MSGAPSEDLNALVGLVAAADERLARLAHAGLTGEHCRCDGEEAALVGAASALLDSDWVFWGAQVCVPALIRGLEPDALFAEALSPGLSQAQYAERRIVTRSHGAAARLPHATGLAWAARHDDIAVLCELGDGAVSDADFHVGVNFAAVMNAPVVFLVRSDAPAVPVLDRAEGYGIRPMAVDGMDAGAVHAGVAEALARARAGDGPTLVEASVKRGKGMATGVVAVHEEAIEMALATAERRRDAVRSAGR